MQVVGIDLGTTNLRISTWDSDQPDTTPQPLTIGRGDSYTMPTVVAFRRQPGGDIETIVGEDADNLEDGPNQIVVRNLKRYALAHDPYVLWHLEAREIEWDSWWNQDSRCVQVWGQDYPVKDLISRMLKEAFQRAGLSLGFEWRAGCPVHAGFTYRAELAQAITELGGTGHGEVSRVIEEPLLLLTLAYELGTLDPGSYLVYDLGGGSFDCALAQVDDDGKMVVYGADGNPTIGGSDIDRFLKADLQYEGPLHLLRLAKEAVAPSNPEDLPGDKVLAWEDYKRAVIAERFFPKTFTSLRDSYISAKCIWDRYEDSPPGGGEVIGHNPVTGEVKFVWELGWKNIAEDIDGIILCGGPTKSPVFLENLKSRFAGTKIISTSELIPPTISEPELTAISAGACYTVNGAYIPLYVNRLPVRITLEDTQTGQAVHYEPYEHLAPSARNPFDLFVSGESLSEELDDPHSTGRYELTITTPDGVVLKTTDPDGVEREHQPVDPYINTRLIGSSLRLVINRRGYIGVEQQSPNTSPKRFLVTGDVPWQIGVPKQKMERLFAETKEAGTSLNFPDFIYPSHT